MGCERLALLKNWWLPTATIIPSKSFDAESFSLRCVVGVHGGFGDEGCEYGRINHPDSVQANLVTGVVREVTVHPAMLHTQRPVGTERDPGEGAMAISNTTMIALNPLDAVAE